MTPTAVAERATKPTTRIETVTPEKAAKWLDLNVNRKPRKGRPTRYAADMASGNWTLSPDAITFDKEGKLRNGQHRLMGVVESGIAQDFIVLRGVEATTQDIMDSGATRNFPDTLTFRGHTDVYNLSSAIRWLHRLEYIKESGRPDYLAEDMPSVRTQLGVLDANPGICEYVRRLRAFKHLGIRAGLGAALWYTMHGLDETDADAFWEKLRTGANLSADDPIYVLRRRLERDKANPRHTKSDNQAAIIVKGWNAWREGEHPKVLSWKYGGELREKFPLPH